MNCPSETHAKYVEGAKGEGRKCLQIRLTMFAAKTLSSSEVQILLNCRRLPGRLSTAAAAMLLGFSEHDIAPLVKAKLLTPLGKPVLNAPKYFSASKIEALAGDEAWQARATHALARHWLEKNRCKKQRESKSPAGQEFCD